MDRVGEWAKEVEGHGGVDEWAKDVAKHGNVHDTLRAMQEMLSNMDKQIQFEIVPAAPAGPVRQPEVGDLKDAELDSLLAEKLTRERRRAEVRRQVAAARLQRQEVDDNNDHDNDNDETTTNYDEPRRR